MLVAAACGSNGSVATPDTPVTVVAPDATGATTTAPTTTGPTATAATSATTAARVVSPNGHAVIDDRGAEVHVASTERVIPLDGDVAEIVYALGLGDRVVATDLSATYPPAADALPQIGYQRALVAEPILAFEPTLLIATDLAGPPETLDDLERVGVPLVVVPDEATPTGAAEKILAVAEALGVPDRGRTLAERVQGEIDAAIDTVADAPTGLRVATLYVRGSGTQLVLGEAYASHWLIEAAGAIDVADELGVVESAPITDEAMLVAAPDVLLVPASGLESVGGVTGLLDALPALARTPAGVAGAVLSYDDQLMLGNGPRAGSFLATLIADLRDRAPTES
ncbi:MAG: ABC transporter substrate-binding protein [Ilumatobacteraceae bacterium]|nr:ABC transporter substrate-binding protein [Ilumatobacteraceae bacterium]